MQLLYFKAIYRDPILRGEKSDTIRRAQRALKIGSIVIACVGPSRPFARLRITAIAPVSLAELAAERCAQVRACYNASVITEERAMIRLHFELL